MRAAVLLAMMCTLVYADQSSGLVPHGGVAVQLVKADGRGGLIVDQNGIEMLKDLGELHVVSVVGQYHSGKSFLMNQVRLERPSLFVFMTPAHLAHSFFARSLWRLRGMPSRSDPRRGQQLTAFGTGPSRAEQRG